VHQPRSVNAAPRAALSPDSGRHLCLLGIAGLGQEVRVRRVGGLEEVGLLPQVGAEEAVALGEREVGRLDEVAHRAGVAAGGGVHVLDACGRETAGAGGGSERAE